MKETPFNLSSTAQLLLNNKQHSAILPEVLTEAQEHDKRTSRDIELDEASLLKALHENDSDAKLMSRSLLSKAPKSVGNRRRRKRRESEWHDIPTMRMTPQLEADLKILENRKHLDKKRFYKSSGRRKGELPRNLHVGTVVEGSHEFYGGRLKNKDRYESWMDELISDKDFMKKTKQKFMRIQDTKIGGDRFIDMNPSGGITKRGRPR